MQDAICSSLSVPWESEQELDPEEIDTMDSPESSALCWIDNMIEFDHIMDEDAPLASSTEQQQQQQQQPEVNAPRPYYAPAAYAAGAYKAGTVVGVPVPRRSNSPAPPVPVPHRSGSPFADVGPGFVPRSSPSSLPAPAPAPAYASQAYVDSPGSSSSSQLGLRQHAHVAHVHGHAQQQQQQPVQHHSQQGQMVPTSVRQQQAHLSHSMSVGISRSNSPQPSSLSSISHSSYIGGGGGTRSLHKVLSAPQLEQLGLEQQQARAAAESPKSFHHQHPAAISGSPSSNISIAVPRRGGGSSSACSAASLPGRALGHSHGGTSPAAAAADHYGMDQYGQQQQQQPMGGQSPHASSLAGSPGSGITAVGHGHGHGHGHGPPHGHGNGLGHEQHGHVYAGHSRNNSLSGQLSHSLTFSNSPPSQQSHWNPGPHSQYATNSAAAAAAAIPMDMGGGRHGGSSSSSTVTRGSQAQLQQVQELEHAQQDNGLQLVHLLLACADAMAQADLIVAKGTLLQLQQMVSTLGDSMHRVAAYFTDALHARLMGKGSRSYRALRAYDPVTSQGVLDAYQILYQVCPYIKFAHFTSNQAIFEAFDGEERVHIIDLDIVQGYQWPTLMQALAARHGGVPQLRITGVGMPLEAVQETGKQLADIADSLHMPFEFHAVGERLENLQAHMLQRRVGEALAVNSVNRLHRLLSMSNDPATPLVGILHMIREQAPKIVTLVEQEASHNDQSFLPRFLEALHYYSAIFDSLDATLPQTSPERAKVEQVVFAQEITNIVACEGTERVERHEKLDRWRKIMDSIGFQSVPLSQNAVQQSHLLLKLYSCSDAYTLVEDRGCLLLGWQDRPIIAASAWRC